MPRSRRTLSTSLGGLTCLVGLCLLVAAARPPAPLVPPAESGVATAAPADTLSRTVTAGEDLILTLPNDATSYATLRAPALSWLVDRSFLWRTRSAVPGTHTITFSAARANAPVDTLVVRVNVTAP